MIARSDLEAATRITQNECIAGLDEHDFTFQAGYAVNGRAIAGTEIGNGQLLAGSVQADVLSAHSRAVDDEIGIAPADQDIDRIFADSAGLLECRTVGEYALDQ